MYSGENTDFDKCVDVDIVHKLRFGINHFLLWIRGKRRKFHLHLERERRIETRITYNAYCNTRAEYKRLIVMLSVILPS